MEYVLIILGALAVICILSLIAGNTWLRVRKYRIKTSKLSTGHEILRVLLISDLHEHSFGVNNKALIEKIENAMPDVIMLGGDFVDTYGDCGGSYEYLFQALPKIAPTYLVLGNHEYSAHRYIEISGVAYNSGIHLLDDAAEELEFEGNVINVIGLSDYKKDNVVCQTYAEKIKNMPVIDFENRLNILLCHRPCELNEIAETGIDVMLSGHTHGGQMRIPLIGGVFTPDSHKLFPKYSMGHYGIGNMDLVVTSGLGSSVIPLRLFNRPEITVIDIEEK